MPRAKILQSAAKFSDLKKRQLKEALTAIVDAIYDGLEKDGRVFIPDLGVFVVRERAKKRGINPKTGETIEIPARRVVVFRPAKVLRESIK